jgi:predicted NodU family carbamoyl transferase
VIILGVNPGIHDGSAALVRDGEVVALVETERLTRARRADLQSPAPAIERCLAYAGVSLDEVDLVALGWDYPPYPFAVGERRTEGEQRAFYQWLLDPGIGYYDVHGQQRLPEPTRELPAGLPPLRFVPHHLAHAAASLWTSGFERAGVVVADGRGELHSTSIGTGDDTGIAFDRSWEITESLGNFYGFACEWAGLSFWDSGKLMGLAAYGRPRLPMPVQGTDGGYRVTTATEPPVDRVDRRAEQQRVGLRRFFADQCYPYEEGDPAEIMAYADFAASVQQCLEDAVFRLADAATAAAGTDRLVIGGGVGMNCSMVGRLARSGRYSDVYVPPFTFDAGVSLGAALLADRDRPGWERPARLAHPYLAAEVGPAELADALAGTDLVVRRLRPADVPVTAARLLAERKVIGWSQGRAEVGQRALGARSILGHPGERAQLRRINRIKAREMWRPLAPSVLATEATALFEGPVPTAAEYMLAACPVRTSAQRLLPACVHVDGTARPQLVSERTNPRFWSLVDHFRQLTGIPAVVNTSFNAGGEPIVFSPRDALVTFTRTGLDALLLEDYLICRSEPLGPD